MKTKEVNVIEFHRIIYIAAYPTPVDVDQVAHACHRIVRPQCSYSANFDDPPTLKPTQLTAQLSALSLLLHLMTLKGLAQAKIIKKSVILFRVPNMTI